MSPFELLGHVTGQHFVEQCLCWWTGVGGKKDKWLAIRRVTGILNNRKYRFSSSPRAVVPCARLPTPLDCWCTSPASSSYCRRCLASCQQQKRRRTKGRGTFEWCVVSSNTKTRNNAHKNKDATLWSVRVWPVVNERKTRALTKQKAHVRLIIIPFGASLSAKWSSITSQRDAESLKLHPTWIDGAANATFVLRCCTDQWWRLLLLLGRG